MLRNVGNNKIVPDHISDIIIKMENKMREIRIEKVTLNMSFGNDQTGLDKGMILMERIAGAKPVKTRSKKRIPNWNIRPGLPIGCKVTLRGKKAEDAIVRLVESKDDKIFKESCFDTFGNMNFGIREYIDIPSVKYDPDLGVMGLEMNITLERPGFRVKKRKLIKGKIGGKHLVSKEEAIKFMKDKFGVEVQQDDS